MATVAQPVATDIDTLCINTIRTLSIDAIQKANSGHPGTPMAMAPVAYTLWQRFLRFDPADPIWPNRDRFVLSAGHASMLLYSLLHLAKVQAVDPDYEIARRALGQPRRHQVVPPARLPRRRPPRVPPDLGRRDDDRAARAGHRDVASGWRSPASGCRRRYGEELFDFDVYAICGDGCLMEGVSNEAASFAGHQRLDNLCWIYDNNHITIDGHTELTYEDDVAARFMGYGWNVTRVGDANDLELLTRAFEEFKEEEDRPTLIIVDSHIGYGSPHKQDTAEAHGEPLGEEEVRETKRAYGWPEDAQFLVPDGVYEHFADGVGERGRRLRAEWEQRRRRRRPAGRRARSTRCSAASCPRAGTPTSRASTPTRRASRPARRRNQVLNAIAAEGPVAHRAAPPTSPAQPVAASTSTARARRRSSPKIARGTSLHYGIREHESAAISNGLALTKLRPVWSTYLTFSDYARPAIRLSALMELPVIHWFSHDSIGLGEDGPTHQPVEQLASLRAMPGLNVIRPCDANEVAEAWRVMMQQTPPADGARPDPPERPDPRPLRVRLGRGPCSAAATCSPTADGEPEVILIATGSEVALAVDAYEELRSDGVQARVVSLPSWYLFDLQDRTSTARACCPRRYRRGSRSSRPRPSAGTATSARRGGSSACTRSARRHR